MTPAPARPAPSEDERTLFIHVTTGLVHCWGCSTTRGVGELVVKDARTGKVVRCSDCAPGRLQ